MTVEQDLDRVGALMSGRTTVTVIRSLVVVSAMLAAVSTGVALVIDPGGWWEYGGGYNLALSVFLGGFVWLIVGKQPRNKVMWAMASVAFAAGLYSSSFLAALIDGIDYTANVPPADMSTAAAWFLMVALSASFVAILAQPTFCLLLFPDGKLPSPRWRWVGWLAGAGIGLAVLANAWEYRPWNTSLPNDDAPLIALGTMIAIAAGVLSLGALVTRFRSSSGESRDQFKWIVWGAAILLPAMVAAVIVGNHNSSLSAGLATVGGGVMIAAYGIAVGKYRLFDVDLVISRTVVVAGLAGFITLVYAVVVGAAGLLLGGATPLPLSVAATVVVAVAFQPVRQRMTRWADRLVYGERATPYEVMSRFSARMRDVVSPEDLIPQMAQLLTLGTSAKRATVWMKEDGGLRPVANWPADEAVPAPVRQTGADFRIPDVDHLAMVEHDGQILGAVTVTMPGHESLTSSQARLVDDVASQAGLVLRNARLTADLVDTIEQLRTSRQRLVAVQDEERRRLERDLHDGAQQQIVAIKTKVALAKRFSEQGDEARASELLDQVMEDTSEAVESLRDLAHGIYPPLLEAQGLGSALRARARKAPISVAVEADDVGRYSPEVEAAVYFCVLEAIQNAIKYSGSDRVDVRLHQVADRLIFEVSDRGRGFDPGAGVRGRGLVNMADRLDALGGELVVNSSPGNGTTVRGSLSSPVVGDQVARASA